jgi:ribosome-associated translation inhibitor RaiA
MQTAPEIIFHEVERSAWLENYILERARRLEKFGEGLTRCHVTVAREVSSHKKGNLYSVMVEVRVPPQHDLAVRKQKEVHDMHKQLPATVNLAFGAMERHLRRVVGKRDEKPGAELALAAPEAGTEPREAR